MEWTFDPLQALNAHLNFARLGVICDEYVRNLYGESTSALHRGTPTDRFVVQWLLREPHVERRVGSREPWSLRASDIGQAPSAIHTSESGKWLSIDGIDTSMDTRRVWVEIPGGFTEMQQEAPDLAREWRLQTRQIFESYFGRGYRAVDFEFQRESKRGRYLLTRD